MYSLTRRRAALYNRSMISERTVQNELAGRVSDIPGVNYKRHGISLATWQLYSQGRVWLFGWVT